MGLDELFLPFQQFRRPTYNIHRVHVLRCLPGRQGADFRFQFAQSDLSFAVRRAFESRRMRSLLSFAQCGDEHILRVERGGDQQFL